MTFNTNGNNEMGLNMAKIAFNYFLCHSFNLAYVQSFWEDR